MVKATPNYGIAMVVKNRGHTIAMSKCVVLAFFPQMDFFFKGAHIS